MYLISNNLDGTEDIYFDRLANNNEDDGQIEPDQSVLDEEEKAESDNEIESEENINEEQEEFIENELECGSIPMEIDS